MDMLQVHRGNVRPFGFGMKGEWRGNTAEFTGEEVT